MFVVGRRRDAAFFDNGDKDLQGIHIEPTCHGVSLQISGALRAARRRRCLSGAVCLCRTLGESGRWFSAGYLFVTYFTRLHFPFGFAVPDAFMLINYLRLFLCCLRLIFQEKRSEEHTSELQSLMRNSYAVFCLKKK